jgi:hypothetical protein
MLWFDCNKLCDLEIVFVSIKHSRGRDMEKYLIDKIPSN